MLVCYKCNCMYGKLTTICRFYLKTLNLGVISLFKKGLTDVILKALYQTHRSIFPQEILAASEQMMINRC